MSRRDHRARARLHETRAIFRKADEAFAPYTCPASGECCQLSKTKREPWVLQSEWETLVEHLEAEGRTVPDDREDGGCPFLDRAGKRCTVYAARPFGCRTFFCERIRGPSRQPVEAVDALLRRLTTLNDEHDESASERDAAALDSASSGPSASLRASGAGAPLTEWIRVWRASLSRQG